MQSKNKIKILDNDFGELLPFIKDERVTDIDYQFGDVWITSLDKGVYKSDIKLERSFIEFFTNKISDAVNKPFNQTEEANVLEAETEDLRIEIVHESISVSGRSITIRKTPAIRRIKLHEMVSGEHPYLHQKMLHLLANFVECKSNIVICGVPGAGKTEFLKTLTQFIPYNDKVVTVEDTPEIHYGEINPGKFYQELKVTDNFDYTKAIKTSMRLNPAWLILSEARSTEVVKLLEAWSTGVSGLSTLHTDDIKKIPDRIQNMMGESSGNEYVQNTIFEAIDIGMVIRRKFDTETKSLYRYVDQLGVFVRENEKNMLYKLVEDGKIISDTLPDSVLKKMERNGIHNPFYNATVANALNE